MRITAADLWLVRTPLVRPYPLSRLYGTLTHAEAVVLRLETAGGLTGWGEADPLMPFTEENAQGVFHFLRDLVPERLIGRDAGELAAITHDIDLLTPGYPTAKGAIDIALHDLVAKAAGVPISSLLGGRLRSSIPVLWPLGSASLEESIEVIEEKREAGFSTFMIKTGSRDVADDAARTLALIERFHPHVRFQADANQGWSESEAMRYVSMIGSAPLLLLEQPVARRNPEGLKRVREASLVPVSADESCFSPHEAARLAATRSADVFSIKPSKNGGLSPARQIAAIAEGHGLSILMNSMIELGITQAASLQLGICLPHLVEGGHAYMSTLRVVGDPTDFSSLVAAGSARAPDGPGLGIAVDEDRLAGLASAHRRITRADSAGRAT